MSDSKIFSALQQHNEVVEQSLAANADNLEQYAAVLAKAFSADCRLLLIGDGVMAGIATVIANTFLYQSAQQRPSLPAVAVNLDAGLATAMNNAGESACYFSCQLQAQATSGDCVCFLTTVASPAIVSAMETARDIGCHVAVVSSCADTDWQSSSPDIILPVIDDASHRLAEAMLFLGQLLCELVEEELFGF